MGVAEAELTLAADADVGHDARPRELVDRIPGSVGPSGTIGPERDVRHSRMPEALT